MKPLFPIFIMALLSGCVTAAQQNPLVGTWKTPNQNCYLRFYSDGKAANWDTRPQFTGGTHWATYDQGALYFHDSDPNLIRRGSTLMVQEAGGDIVYHRLPSNLAPPQ